MRRELHELFLFSCVNGTRLGIMRRTSLWVCIQLMQFFRNAGLGAREASAYSFAAYRLHLIDDPKDGTKPIHPHTGELIAFTMTGRF